MYHHPTIVKLSKVSLFYAFRGEGQGKPEQILARAAWIFWIWGKLTAGRDFSILVEIEVIFGGFYDG